MLVNDQLGDKDISRTRVFELENGNKLYAKQTDPYGFWYLNLDKGQLPDWLKDQAFNEYSQVLKAIEKYSHARKQAIDTVNVKNKKVV